MSSKEKIIRLKKMANAWNQLRWNGKKALKLLNTGTFFTIKQSDVLEWQTQNPEWLHAYFGVEGKKLFFILIDSVTDKIPMEKMSDEEIERIKVREFNNDLDLLTYDFIADETGSAKITVKEALSRNLRWQMMKESWINEQIAGFHNNQAPIGLVFRAPFSDLKTLLIDENQSTVSAVMGLKFRENPQPEESTYLLDLTFWGMDDSGTSTVKAVANPDNPGLEDLTALVPPYSAGSDEDYSLITS